MVKKIILNLFFLLIFAVIIFFAFLSTIGIETNRFNKVIIDKIAETNNIDVDLKTIKFKLDLKDLSLYLETNKPVIVYKKIVIPSNDVKVYLDFLSLIKTNLKIQKISIDFEEIDIKQINKLSKIIKPSNFKSFLNNKVLEGKLTAVIEIFLNNEGGFKNYIARGKIKSFKVNLFRDFKFSEVNLDFFADKDDIIFKNIFGNVEGIVISNGDIKLNLENGIKLTSNFSFLSNRPLITWPAISSDLIPIIGLPFVPIGDLTPSIITALLLMYPPIKSFVLDSLQLQQLFHQLFFLIQWYPLINSIFYSTLQI